MSTLSAILHQLCPRCRIGKIFRGSLLRGFPRMHERCPVCDLKFEREEGYFLGAMYISYGIGVVMICAFATALWMLTRWSLQRVVLLGILIFVPFAPGITLFSRVLWIYLDRSVDPEKDQ
jgi:uncharacterized protein (DUF983 family)